MMLERLHSEITEALEAAAEAEREATEQRRLATELLRRALIEASTGSRWWPEGMTEDDAMRLVREARR
ncbi:hypothetical protein KBTX_02465 [wastewater metagenome]|uniref:Uncharacterized protein n=2 Tax=unclassified sequences TaxID=12908 RepID=A0A5B8RGY1_9ZZZZ|nr:hypothetical protein [Arhodomonas sp. KWT]QEA06135.1 hypothetical protein KBTEX_02465 [uncultured organism]